MVRHLLVKENFILYLATSLNFFDDEFGDLISKTTVAYYQCWEFGSSIAVAVKVGYRNVELVESI